MTSVGQFIDTIRMTDWQTLAVIAVLCGVACLFLKDYMAIPIFVIFVYPIFVFISVVIHHVFVHMELYPSNRLEQWLLWTILAAILGTISGTALIAAISAFRDRKIPYRGGH